MGFADLDVQLKAAVVAAGAGILGAIIAGAFALAPSLMNHDDSKKKANPCTKKIKITSPKPGVDVMGKDGVVLKGTACDLADGESGWIFDHDFEGHRYYVDSATGDADPVITENGDWSFPNEPIGNEGDKNARYSIVVVLATPTCASKLRALPEEANSYSVSDFPKSWKCQVLDSRDVLVTWPKKKTY